MMLGSPDCTPGYYNNEGQDPAGRPPARRLPGGRDGLLQVHRRVADQRTFDGLAFTRNDNDDERLAS